LLAQVKSHQSAVAVFSADGTVFTKAVKRADFAEVSHAIVDAGGTVV